MLGEVVQARTSLSSFGNAMMIKRTLHPFKERRRRQMALRSQGKALEQWLKSVEETDKPSLIPRVKREGVFQRRFR
jgi:hypothetical protein